MNSLIRFFFRQSLFGNIITFLVFFTGIVSLFQIRKDLFPQVSYDITLVTVVYPGASPDQVEKLVINPIEEALREVDGIKKVISNSIDSRGVVTITLDPDARKVEKTNQDIQRAIDRIEKLPEESDKPVVTVLESGQTPVIELSLSSDTIPEIELREWARKTADELSFVPGVARVTKTAWQKLEWVVEVDQQKLKDAHLSLSDVVQALKTQNIQLPAGDMVLENGREVSVKTDGEYITKEDIENTPVRINFDGFGYKVKDLATVKQKLEKPTIIYRTNGEKAFSMIISKKEKADALKVVDQLQDKMKQYSLKYPEGIKYRFVNDFTIYLRNRLGILSSNMLLGIFLVLGVLALFFPWRVAVVVALGIPFSMLAAIAILWKIGFSINLISLIGLIIVSGMLVDDAIVVVENVFRRYEMGDSLEVAVIEGTLEVIPAVTASVLTTVAAFSPMLFMSGIFGKFIFEIPVMVIIPLIVSLLEAFLIAPGHFKDIVGNHLRENIAILQQKESKQHWYDRVLPYYRKTILWTVRNKYKTLGLFFGLIVVTGGVASRMNFILFPPDGIYTFFVRVDGEPGATLEEMKGIVSQIEPNIKKLGPDELQDFISQIGIQQNDPNDPLTKRASHYAQIRVNLTPEGIRTRKVDDIVNEVRKMIPTEIKGMKRLQYEIAKGGPPQGRPISINVLGDDFVTLRKLADEIKKELSGIDGVIDIEDSEVIGKKEIRVVPNPDALSKVDLSVAEVSQNLRAAFAGLVATSTRTLNEEIDIRVKMKEESAVGKNQIDNVFISNRTGGLIPISRIVKTEESPSRLVIQHEKYRRLINVSAQVDLQKTTAIKATQIFEKKMSSIVKNYPDYQIVFGGESEDTQESMASLGRAFLFAFLMIFALLIITFRSFIQPILVALAIPLGFVGTIWALVLHGKPLSFMSMLGLIALAGVIVNNAIVYIDFFNSLKGKMSLEDALVGAATTRLRPIILTSVTTVLGLFPTAYGIGGSDGFVKSLALALGWGLALGSVLTVLTFPAILATVEAIQDRLNKLFSK
ncbi:MAG: acriflavin resistance protein [Oligoflexia bacterium]|nr:MAG: acriflavin resistance protein [Oligoflexia bacterium]